MILYNGPDKRLRRYSIFMVVLAIFFLAPLVAEHTWEAGMVWQDGRTNESVPMMLKAMYLSLSICVFMGAKDPVRNAIIIDYSMISSLIHGLVMLYYSIILEWERTHLYGDVLMLLVLAVVLFFYHPRKIARSS
ncbi:DUF6632 domain-containing protein [Emcibacter nanhaiensis]|uniref:Uncharacterized protein n=1 Tax=Emcibacter nanhaiensis TaxID=1505037 RepID=A0A501PJH2_9PROT|nr:DUF6632 domain-containing protein [Emcibacter nanhaiensis]TPD60660.1 hypothetical protein FIV46_08005 [Emcibacter nanhaiensis]